MFHETHFPNPSTLWTQNVFPKSQNLESSSSLLCSCFLRPPLSASKESLLIVQIDSQLGLIYCWMIYWAAALSPCASQVLADRQELPRACTRLSLLEREMLCGYKEAFSAQQLETTDCLVGETLWHLLIPSNSLKRDLPQINLWNGNANTQGGRRTAARPHPVHANSKNLKKVKKCLKVCSSICSVNFYSCIFICKRRQQVKACLRQEVRSSSHTRQVSVHWLQHPWDCHLCANPSWTEHCLLRALSPSTSTPCFVNP